MSKDVNINRSLRLVQESRKIVKEIINFGITESQKYDIISMLTLELENNDAMKDISKVLKKYKTSFNNDKEENSIIEKKEKKILLT